MAGEILSDADIADLQAVAVEFQPDTCDVIRVTETSGSGGVSEVETVLASGVSGIYSEDLTPQDVQQGAARAIQISAKIDIPADQDVRADDRLNVYLRGTLIGKYEVSAVIRQSYEALRTVYLRGPV